MEYFGTNLTEYGHYRWDMDKEDMYKKWTKFDDLPFNPESLTNNLPKGDVVFYQGGGFTVIGIAGSCVDERGGTESIFWVKEIISRTNLITKMMQNRAVMKIIRAFSFEIKWNIPQL